MPARLERLAGKDFLQCEPAGNRCGKIDCPPCSVHGRTGFFVDVLHVSVLGYMKSGIHV